MILRQYQQQAIIKAQNGFRHSKRVFLTLPTGGGKTIIFSEIAKRAVEKGRNVWIVVPRNELIWQASDKLRSIGVPHGVIAPGFNESKLYQVHIVSKDTWIRRKKYIMVEPQFIIVDEGHLATNRYLEMIDTYPSAFYLFVSATPERLDGKPLTGLAPEDHLIYGPTIKWLIENQYLSKIKYYCPPVSGINGLKRSGTEIDPEQLEAWLQEKKIYGKTIDHYRKHCQGRQSIIYCRSVKLSETTAEKFQDAGYSIESIDGKMARGKIKARIDAVRSGELDGLSSCELITYGLDVPNVSAIVMMRPTLSRALYFQMLGRGLRFQDSKDCCVVLDHVGNARRHCDGGLPWDPVAWNYSGKKAGNKRTKKEHIKYCPYLEYMPCSKPSCIGCEYNEDNKPIREWSEIDGELVAVSGNIDIRERPKSEKDYYISKIDSLCNNVYADDGINDASVNELVQLAKETGRKPLWIYFEIRRRYEPEYVNLDPKLRIVDHSLLESIRRSCEYKPGWTKYAEKIVKGELTQQT